MHLHDTVTQIQAKITSAKNTLFLLSLLIALTCPVAAPAAPTAVFNPISIQLDSTANYTLSAAEIGAISAGSSGNGVAITNRTVVPASFNFCDVGSKPVTLTVTDANGNSASQAGNLTVRRPASPPAAVYVSANYAAACGAVSFPGTAGTYYVGYNAFNSIQKAVDAVANGGTVQIAAGVYVENVTISKSLALVGPNGEKSGTDITRGAEAVILPAINDPENTPIIAIVTNYVVVDGLVLDGNNPALGSGYQGNGARLNAAAGVQNGVYPDLSNVSNLTIQNNIIRNVSYDGIYLDRIDFFNTASAGNFILNNKFEDMWEGILTYALHSVIANNAITNVNRGLSLHGTITDAGGFVPAITNNQLTVAQWWPTEISRLRAIGIWINYRRDKAAPLWVADNVVATPVAMPSNATVRGLEALGVDGQGTVTFVRNTVKGFSHCDVGVYASACWSNNAVQVLAGSLEDVQVGVLAATKDPDYGSGNVFITLSNVTIHTTEGGSGVVAEQDPSTSGNSARVNVVANSSVMGGAIGVGVHGLNAAAAILNNSTSITGNGYGVDVQDGKAVIENNDLSGNSQAAIHVAGVGIVDAGDCSGSDITGLRAGSGVGGSSAGHNVLTGYGFDSKAPWAIESTAAGVVKAQHNQFGATPVDQIATVVSGSVDYSQSGGAFIVCPGSIHVHTIDQIPMAAATVAEFIALGGIVSDNAGTLTHSNFPAVLVPGDQTVYRTYWLTDPCGEVVSSTQMILVMDLPKIGVHPCGRTNHVSTTATFQVSASGSGPLMYRWQKDGVALNDDSHINGSAAAMLSLSAVVATDAGAYTVVVSNPAGSTTSSAAMLTVVDWPTMKLVSYSNAERRPMISVSGAIGLRYAIRATTNLVDWEMLVTNTVPYDFTDVDAPAIGARFYQCIWLP